MDELANYIKIKNQRALHPKIKIFPKSHRMEKDFYSTKKLT